MIYLLPKLRFYLLSAFLFCAFCLQINVYSQTAPSNNETPARTDEISKQIKTEPENLIHFGDLIDVDIIGSTEYDWRGRVNPEGFLDGLDFIEKPVYALCRSEKDVAEDVVKGYEKLLREPKVTVKIIDKTGRPNSFLYGAVKTPHRFLLQRQVYLNELIVLAGGLTDKASGEIQIIRPSNLSCGTDKEIYSRQGLEKQSQKISTSSISGDTKTINIKISDLLRGDKDSNPLISNGDIITVLEATPVYVIGGVSNPKQINANVKLTVSRAIAGAGGLTKSADPKNIVIFRRSAGETKVIQVNLEDIEAQKTEDIILQKFDIIDVGQTGGEKRAFPPVIKPNENLTGRTSEIPLRIVR